MRSLIITALPKLGARCIIILNKGFRDFTSIIGNEIPETGLKMKLRRGIYDKIINPFYKMKFALSLYRTM